MQHYPGADGTAGNRAASRRSGGDIFASGQRLRTSHVLDCTARKNTADAMLIKRKARPAKYKISLPVFVNCYPLIGIQ